MPPAITVKQLIRANDPEDSSSEDSPVWGWRIVWGPTSGRSGRLQLILSWALGTDGLTVVPLVAEGSSVVQAATISADFRIDHPLHYTRIKSGSWVPYGYPAPY
jgi:hypothetical protein